MTYAQLTIIAEAAKKAAATGTRHQVYEAVMKAGEEFVKPVRVVGFEVD
jgi:hypothetical protein